MRQITLALTNFNRFNLLIDSFAKVLDDPRVGEILISDDASDLEIFNKIVDHFKDNKKVRIHRNISTQGVYHNKYASVFLSTNEWVIVFDSDNIIGQSYIDALFEIPVWDLRTVYAPDFARPELDYTNFSGHTITRENVGQYYHWARFDALINTMNFVVNREEFLKNYDPDTEPIAADSIYFNYRWLNAGNKFYVVPGMQYEHLIHKGSHYVNNSHKSNIFHASIMSKLKHMT